MMRLAPLLLLALPAFALDVPYLSGRVNDDANMIDEATEARLESTLKAYEDKTGRQFAVLTIPSLEGEALEDFSLKVARTWRLGRRGQDDGLLLLVARDDRKVRIEAGYGLEGSLPDALAGRIVRGEIVPRFRQGDHSGGIAAGVDATLAALEGRWAGAATPAPDADERPKFELEGRNDFAGMGWLERILVSFFVFGILGVFELVGIFAPGVGWFLYFFLIPFWAAFPMAIWGAKLGAGALAGHLLGFPLAKIFLPRTRLGAELGRAFHQGGGRGGRSSGRSSGWSSGGGGWSSGSSGGGFSGGGGGFGGGGASGSW